MLRKEQPNYILFLKNFHPNEIQTKCEALARFRCRRIRQKARRGRTLFEKQRLKIHEGKATMVWAAEFRRV